MSDGYSFHYASPGYDPAQADAGAPRFASAHRSDRVDGALPFVLADLAAWLPRLGTVLWLERPDLGANAPMRISAGTRVMLLEHAAAGTLARCASLRAHSVVTPHGPREWLCLHAESGEINAKLFLLPDSDFLAWDQMSAASGLVPATASAAEAPTHVTFLRRALARFGQRWQARLIEFDLKPMPWLHTLGAHAPLRISLLGLDIARTIVRDENAEWISPLHLA